MLLYFKYVGLDDFIFESIISPTYYATYLAYPLQLIKQILSYIGSWNIGYDNYISYQQNHQSQLQGQPESLQSSMNCDQQHIQNLSEVFLESDLFSEIFFSKLMGIFICNNLEMQYLDIPYTPTNLTTIYGEIKDETGDIQSVNILTPVPVTVVESEDSQDYQVGNDDRRQVSENHTSHGDTGHGTGLFSTYSKMNHSCVCNTYNVMNTNIHSNTKNTIGIVSVYASTVIHKGEEITTSYLHVGDVVDGGQVPLQHRKTNMHSSLPLEDRQNGLLQYLFTCSCPLCVSQILENSSINPTCDY